jgi:hypothetical protein
MTAFSRFTNVKNSFKSAKLVLVSDVNNYISHYNCIHEFQIKYKHKSVFPCMELRDIDHISSEDKRK